MVIYFFPLRLFDFYKQPLSNALTTLDGHWLVGDVLYLDENFILRSVLILIYDSE